MQLSSDFAVPGDSVTPPTATSPAATPPAAALTRREARDLETSTAPKSIDDFVEVVGAAPTRRDDRRPVSPKSGKRVSPRKFERQFRRQVRVTGKRRPTARRPRNDRDRQKPRIGQRFLSLGAMLFVGVIAIGMSVPANAFITQTISAPGSDQLESNLPAQSMEVGDEVAAVSASRDAFSVLSWAEVLTLQYGTRSYEYTVGTGTVRWPFPFASPISDGYGARVAPCYGCSTFHNGVDFTPGGGSPIYAIADGVVRYAEVSDYGFGNHVYIVSEINGHQVESLYAHMQMNSSPLHAGDVVHVGDFVGLVGMTGTATGNHLHFEIKLDGVNVDPFAYLQQTVN